MTNSGLVPGSTHQTPADLGAETLWVGRQGQQSLRSCLKQQVVQPPKKAADMLRIDLDAAPYVVDGPDGPRYADFHSLRHSFIAMLDKSGATLKEAMQLARHSDHVGLRPGSTA